MVHARPSFDGEARRCNHKGNIIFVGSTWSLDLKRAVDLSSTFSQRKPGMFNRFPSLVVGVGLFVALSASGCEQKGGPVNVDRIEPGTGSTMGGDLITIVGSGFEPGKTQADVLFGRRKAENIIIASSSTINVVTPAGDRGPIDVSVMFHDGKAFKIANGFKYIPPTEPSSARQAWEKQGSAK